MGTHQLDLHLSAVKEDGDLSLKAVQGSVHNAVRVGGVLVLLVAVLVPPLLHAVGRWESDGWLLCADGRHTGTGEDTSAQRSGMRRGRERRVARE